MSLAVSRKRADNNSIVTMSRRTNKTKKSKFIKEKLRNKRIVSSECQLRSTI